MEADSTNIVEEAALEMDEMLADVMPRSWEGHARIAIHNSDDVPASVEEKAIAKALKLADKNGKSPKSAARGLIRALKEQQS